MTDTKLLGAPITLYPVDSTFGYQTIDFLGAAQKTRDDDYAEGFVGNVTASFPTQADLGGDIYMFTNGVLGIVQQQAVEWHARRGSRKNRPEGRAGSLPAGSGPSSTADASGATLARENKTSGRGKGKRRQDKSGQKTKVSAG